MPPPSFEEQISFLGGGYLAPEQEGEQQTFFSQPQLSQQVIDEALCIGFNDQNSRLIICAYFMKDKPLEENAAFLRKSYGTNGAGLFIQDREYAIWYDPEGIRIATGRTVQKPWSHGSRRQNASGSCWIWGGTCPRASLTGCRTSSVWSWLSP